MLREIITKEITSSVKSPRFWVSFLACFILILLVCYINSKDYVRELSDYHKGMQFYEDYLNNYANSNHWVEFNMEPPPKLSIWFKRPGGEHSDIIIFESGANIRRVSSNRLLDVLFPSMCLGKMIGIVLGLFCIILAFDSITGEREAGTLKLLMSNAIPRHIILLGKWIGQSLCIIIPSLFSIIFGILLVSFHPLIQLETQDFLGLAGIFVRTIIFLNLWFTIALLVSLKTKRSTTSFLVLLGVWTILTVVIPSISPYLAEKITNIPMLKSLEYTIQRADDEMRREKDEIAKSIMNRTKEDRQKALEWGFPKLKEVSLKYLIQKRRMKESYNAQIFKQAEIGQLLSSISPFAVFIYAVRDFSETGIHRILHFYRQQVEYKNQLGEFQYGIFMELLHKGNTGYNRIDGHLVPRPDYREEKFIDRVYHSLKWIVILFLYNVVVFLAAYVSFLRYQVV